MSAIGIGSGGIEMVKTEESKIKGTISLLDIQDRLDWILSCYEEYSILISESQFNGIDYILQELNDRLKAIIKELEEKRKRENMDA